MKTIYNKTMPIVQIALGATDKQIITDYINQYRALHDSPPLIWDDQIASFADNWSSYLLKNNGFYHSNNKLYGENLAYFQGYNATPLELIKKSIDLWYNIIGQFKENVLPLKNSGIPEPTPIPTPLPIPVPEPMPIPIPTPLPVPEPIPTPLPVPEPMPIPLPEPTPLPDYKLLKQTIIAKLYETITKIQQQYPRYIISNNLTDIYNQVSTIPDAELYNKYSIMNALKNIISAIRYRYSPYIIIRVLNNVITEFQRSLF